MICLRYKAAFKQVNDTVLECVVFQLFTLALCI